jgi:phenylpropionate dioxygenase-like ring-hydroxylating dioxygenase large terminal subunit
LKIQDIAQDIIATAQRPLDQAQTLPRQAYTDETYFAHESDQVLRASWLCAGHVSQVKAPGAVLPVDLMGEPVMLVHGHDGVIRALSRVCPHRSSDLLIDGEKSDCRSASVLTCPYHRWTFGLDGSLMGAPQMQEAAGFNKSDWKLAELRSAIWEGFIFVNLDAAAAPLKVQYEAFTATVAPWKLAGLELVISLEWECDFNWKVMVENWIESYHHLGPHVKTLNPFMPAQDTWTEPPNPAFIHAHLPLTGRDAAPMRDAIANGEAGSGFLPLPGIAPARQAEWNLFVGFPCFMLLLARDRAIWYRLQPISAERCKLTTTTLVSRESLSAPGYLATLEAETKMLKDFHLEDMAVNEAVQRGLRSRHVVRGRLSHLEEPVWQFHRLLAARMAALSPREAALTGKLRDNAA